MIILKVYVKDIVNMDVAGSLLGVAGKTMGRKGAEVIGQEVETLYTNGPAGGAGATKSFSEIFAVQSVMLPREFVTPTVLVESLG